MEVGHIFKIGDIEYCICDIKKIDNREFAYAISGEAENTKITFFELLYNDKGVLIEKVKDNEIIAYLFNIFSDNIESLN